MLGPQRMRELETHSGVARRLWWSRWQAQWAGEWLADAARMQSKSASAGQGPARLDVTSAWADP